MDFRLSWLVLSTHCTTTCRVQTRLKRKHRNPTKIPPGTNSLSRAGAPGVVDERGREDLRGGGQVNISSSTTKIFYIGSSNQRWCRGPVFSLTTPQVFITRVWISAWKLLRCTSIQTTAVTGVLEAYYQSHLAGLEPTELALIPEQVWK